ncbi:MAG: hypothetical protein QW507_00660 [Candidatus Nanoarchaeia archaeon]|nr:hypothetical protein [Candidatus Haiyanarchaeum thermophilum]MCW1302907.1 hypothetical protein [Candidatus Haiyanarchaeum thermophilum]MCW1303586.1 hypothetical protein [Candidatus Haiyanarchaeum thermophilum]MCW1306268.1 hypothetical protein [Candidatus Haiyanarchaeum thermophilum]MCW1307496.1 hypothetical protein [Candidatus Haiyanarchaeum thermophilum]
MRTIVLDSSSIISLSTTCLLWILKKLKEIAHVRFVIPRKVKEEVVDISLTNPNYQLDGIRILNYIGEGIIEVVDDARIQGFASRFLDLANNLFVARGRSLKLIHYGEAEVVALSKIVGTKNLCVDEKTMRILLEDPIALKRLMERKLHTPIEIRNERLEELKKNYGDFLIFRSAELLMISYRRGVFTDFLAGCGVDGWIRKRFLRGALTSLKLNGCSISRDEILEYVELISKNHSESELSS